MGLISNERARAASCLEAFNDPPRKYPLIARAEGGEEEEKLLPRGRGEEKGKLLVGTISSLERDR